VSPVVAKINSLPVYASAPSPPAANGYRHPIAVRHSRSDARRPTGHGANAAPRGCLRGVKTDLIPRLAVRVSTLYLSSGSRHPSRRDHPATEVARGLDSGLARDGLPKTLRAGGVAAQLVPKRPLNTKVDFGQHRKYKNDIRGGEDDARGMVSVPQLGKEREDVVCDTDKEPGGGEIIETRFGMSHFC